MSEYNYAIPLPGGIIMNAACTHETPNQPEKIFPHTHRHRELYFFVRGDCSYMVESSVDPLSFGTAILTRPGELHGVQLLSPCLYERYYCYIPQDAFAFCGEPSPMRVFTARPFGQENAIVLPQEIARDCCERFRRIRDLFCASAADMRSRALAELLIILTEINRARECHLAAESRSSSDELLNRALQCISAELSSIQSTTDLAQRLYVSREYLSRTFRQSMGISLSRYILLKRIELAKHLLRRGVPLIDVSIECGFSDYTYFITAFRRMEGVTPARYQRMK